MKQLIIPIVIIVALISFFVIIDRKEVSRHDDVQTFQSKSPLTNRKSLFFASEISEINPVIEVKPTVETWLTETKPVATIKTESETNLVEVKPVTQINPIETKFSFEANPGTEIKPAINRFAETNSVAETRTVVKPAAVPVATDEEAIRANEEALKLLSKKEAFTRPKDIESVAKKQSYDKLVPMAVPVLTPEEAIKINKEAIKIQRNKAIAKGFQSFIQKIGLNRIHFIPLRVQYPAACGESA